MVLNTINVEGVSSHLFPRGYKDITSIWNEGSLFKRLHGTDGFSKLEDLYVGDYFDTGVVVRAPNSTTYPGTSWFTIAGINTFMYKGWNPNHTEDAQVAGEDWINFDHLVLVPGKGEYAECFGDGQMYASTPFTGGYISSKMYTTILGGSSVSTSGTINYQLYQIFGSHLKPNWELCSSANNSTSWNRLGSASGASTSWSWNLGYSWLMTEIEVSGSVEFSSSGFDIGTANHQLPLFAFSEEARCCRALEEHYWNRDVASGSKFCYYTYYGISAHATATYFIGVRPRLLVS